jgi:Domain of unknown function (DUF4279)
VSSMPIKVYFCLDSAEFTLTRLNELVGLEPDEGWDAGHTYSVANKMQQHKFTRWQINEFCDRPAFVEEAADELVRRLSSMRKSLVSLPAEVRRSLTIEITTDETLFGLGLKKETVAFLAELGADIDSSWAVKAYTKADVERMLSKRD